jgi:trimethylamine--corrinoid protein Co-methyltransferase
MAVARFKFLDRDEEDLVHRLSLEVLGTIGVRIHSPSVLRMLEKAGAAVDQKSMVAKIPERMIKDALGKVPESFTIGGRDRNLDVRLPAISWPYVALGGVTTWIEDYQTKKHKEATTEDLAQLTRIGDAMPGVDLIWPIVTARDVPPHACFANELWTAFKNTTKPIHGSAGSGTVGVADAKVQIRLGNLISGGEKEMKKRPPFTVLSCVIAPLTFEKGAVEAQCEYARAGIPVISMSMSLGGSTCPMSVAGTIVNANSENLASLVITQTASPGAPHIYSSESTLVDVRTGFIGYLGVETPMIFAACGQMAARYGLPKMTGTMGMDGKTTGNPTTLYETFSSLFVTMNGTDLCSGIGGLDADAGCSAEQIVIDANIWEEFREFMRIFEISEKTAAIEVMRQVGQGNTFLTHPHTVRNFKSQVHFRDKAKDVYGATMSTDMREEAHKVVEKILREHRVPQLDVDVIREGDQIVKEYAKSPPTV